MRHAAADVGQIARAEIEARMFMGRLEDAPGLVSGWKYAN
jgi:hypothetical protein